MDNLNSVSPRKISLFVFDFDGTLVDTLADISNSVNLTLRELGLSTLEVDAIKDCVGRGVVRLMTGALKGTGYTALDHAVELFRKHYSEHLVEQTDFYPNCRETLEYFSDKTHAIFSNKPEDFIKRILDELNFKQPFKSILGGDSLENKKPHPQGLTELMKRFKLSPEEVLMVGDTAIDIEAGKRAGVQTCGVAYGLGDPAALKESGPDYMIHDFSELKKLFC